MTDNDTEVDMIDRIHLAYTARMVVEEEFENDFLDVLDVQHHADHHEQVSELDVIVDVGASRDDIDNELYGDLSTYALDRFVSNIDLSEAVEELDIASARLDHDRTYVDIGADEANRYDTDAVIRQTYRVEVEP